MNTWTHCDSWRKRSILRLSWIFSNSSIFCKLIWTHWSFGQKQTSNLINLFKYFDIFALLLEKVFAFDWKVVPPKLFFLIFHFVHFSLLEIGFSTVLIPTGRPIPIFLHLMTEGMSPQSLNFMWFIGTVVMLGSLSKMLRKENDKIVPFLIDKSFDGGKISTYLMRGSFLEIVIVRSYWNKIRFSGILDCLKMRNHVQNDLVGIDSGVGVEFIGRYYF